MIRLEGYRLEVTESGRRLIDPARTGELAAIMLRAKLLDPGYEDEADDGVDPNRPIRRRLKLLLWRLSRLDAARWYGAGELTGLLTLPEMVDEIRAYSGGAGSIGFIISSMVLNSCADFGLLRCDLETDPGHFRYQKTLVFDRLLSWRV